MHKNKQLKGKYVGQLQHAAILFEWVMFDHIDLHNSGYKLNETLSLVRVTVASDIGFPIGSHDATWYRTCNNQLLTQIQLKLSFKEKNNKYKKDYLEVSGKWFATCEYEHCFTCCFPRV